MNVGVPIFLGRIVEDLATGKRECICPPALSELKTDWLGFDVETAPYVDITFYVVASFLSDSNRMLYRYLYLPLEQHSEREMNQMSFDCLLK